MGVGRFPALFVVVIVCLGFPLTYGQWRHPRIASKEEEKQGYSRAPGFENEYASIKKEDLIRLKRIMEKIPIKNTPLEIINELAKLAEKGVEIDWEESIVNGEESFIEQLRNDATLRDTIFGYLDKNGLSRSLSGERLQEPDKDVPEPEDRQQTQGWEGCAADFDAYLGPVAEEWFYEYLLRIREDDLLGLFLPNIKKPSDVPSWATFLMDSFAKRPPGVMQGRRHWVGAAEQCIDQVIRFNASGIANETRVFKGQYARLELQANLFPSLNISLTPFMLGICVPDTCNIENITNYLQEANPITRYMLDTAVIDMLGSVPNIVGRNITGVYLGQTLNFKKDIAAKAAVGIMIAGIIIIAISSCYDGWGRDIMIRKRIKKEVSGSEEEMKEDISVEDLKWAKKYLYGAPSFGEKLEVSFAAYSAYSNIGRIFSAKPFQNEDHVPVLDGIKVLTIMWLVKGLSYVYGVVYYEVLVSHNIISAFLTKTKEWSFMSTLSVYHANTALFYVSGFVCVQMWYRTFKRNDSKMSFMLFLKYFAFRWFSLMPPMMGMLMLFTCLYRYMASGPMYPLNITDADNCRSTWWLVFLLFHNVARTGQQCFAWTWMFAAVWQLNMVSIVILIPLVLAPVGGYVLLAMMYVAHIIVTGLWHKKVADGELGWFFGVYQTPWCQAGPYCIGMMMAIIMHNTKGKWHLNCTSPRHPRNCYAAAIIFCWIFAMIGIGITIYLPWDRYKPNGNEWSETGKIVFDVLSDQAFALSLAWITWACHKGYGGVVGSLLNWKAFTALAKLALPATVFMAPAMQSYMYARLQPFYIHDSHMTHLYYGHLIGVFMASLMTALGYYYPMGRGMKLQFTVKTRLEIMVYANHPEILSQFTGDPDLDKPIWDVLEERDRLRELKSAPTAMSTGGGVIKTGKPIGGYVACQDNMGSQAFPVVSTIDIPEIRTSGQVNQGFESHERDSPPPKYQELPLSQSINPVIHPENNDTAF